MNQTEKVIWKFFKPYFNEYPRMRFFRFTLYNHKEPTVSDEDWGINGKRWDNLPDQELYKSAERLEVVINKLPERMDLDNMRSVLNDYFIRLTKMAKDSNPLVSIGEDVWSEENRKELNKRLKKCVMKEYQWNRNLNAIDFLVSSDGQITVNENWEPTY
jgi:hypothetical protein